MNELVIVLGIDVVLVIVRASLMTESPKSQLSVLSYVCYTTVLSIHCFKNFTLRNSCRMYTTMKNMANLQ